MTWKSVCQNIWEQEGVYFNDTPEVGNWKFKAQSMLQIRQRWNVASNLADLVELDSTKQFQVEVSVRFRPASAKKMDGIDDEKDENKSTVVVPLHQRLQLIKAQFQCSQSEAQKILWGKVTPDGVMVSSDAPDPFENAEMEEQSEMEIDRDPTAAPSNSIPSQEGVPAAPARESQEAADKDAKVLAYESTDPCVLSVEPKAVWMVVPRVGLRQFSFERVLHDRTEQEEVYTRSATPIIEDFMNGINGSIFCYGQTGSGKTHTMFGANSAHATKLVKDLAVGGKQVVGVHNHSGIVPRACLEIITAVAERKAQGEDCSLEMTYVEVYGDVVSDLLREGEVISVWQGVAARSVIEGMAAHKVGSVHELQELLQRGESNKRYAATAMNDRSSRAHSLLVFSLKRQPPNTGLTVTSKLCLADLGGSEQVKKSKAIQEDTRLLEAVQINLGLLALKQCIAALLKKSKYIPFQDSVLTQLLQMSLGGGTRTAVIVTTSMESANAIETIQTLRFGEKCAKVKNAGGKVNQAVFATSAIESINKQLEGLIEQIAKEERWEEGIPIGAEDLRERYEDLLERRRVLFGH